MTNRSVHMIFEPSGLPIPSEEEVRFEAQEIVSRSGWGVPLIEALRKVRDPYWREAVARCLMENWLNLVRDKDEQTYYYDSDGDMRYCWMDAECDFGRIIRRSTHEQVDYEQETTENEQPKHEHRIMEQKYTQINIGTQNNNCTQYNIGTQIINNFYGPQDATAQPEDATEKPVEVESCLFTRKAIQENKQEEITRALQRSLTGRKDKARALVKEVRHWQKEGYIDANYNARVMYDELNKIITLPFLYGGFRKYYNG